MYRKPKSYCDRCRPYGNIPRAKTRENVGSLRVLSATSGYEYGWPSGGISEPNVKAQFLFDESASPIVDEVGGLSLAETATPEYGQAATSIYANLSPGIKYVHAAAEYHRLVADSTALDIGATDHCVIEWWASATDQGVVDYQWALSAQSTTLWGIYCNIQIETICTIAVEMDDGTQVNNAFTISSWHDGVPHKFRFVYERGASMELFLDGVSQGSKSVVSQDGKVMTNKAITMAASMSGTNGANGNLYEWRCSIGTDVLTNNSGGPEGG